MKAQFDPKEVKVLLEQLPANAEVVLVGDQGVYLMSFAQKPGARTIVYAKGMNPNVDDFDTWWANKNRIFGGDDGSDKCGVAGELIEWFKQGSVESFFVDITPNEYATGCSYGPDHKAMEAYKAKLMASFEAAPTQALLNWRMKNRRSRSLRKKLALEVIEVLLKKRGVAV